jgi:non-specific serine/threonine protein kinase
MPVISRTYCDPKSYAWDSEFRTFVEQASYDKFGLKIKLPDGNVASRILPVIIHDLDRGDIQVCENLIGGNLRGVEFIYKEPGVNRPLTKLDDEEKNLNGTRYRNQINRVANAVREIIAGIRSEPVDYRNLPADYRNLPADYRNYPAETFNVPEKLPVPEKSIIVLPFENISADPEQDYFSNGLTEEVISDLSHISDLLVISRSSAMTFKGTKSTIREIAEKVNVKYVLEGSVRKSADSLRINAQLIDSQSDLNIWGEKYTGKLEDIFDIQEKVSQSIAAALKIKLSSTDELKIHERPIENVSAFDCYKKAFHEIFSYNREGIETGLKLLQQGLDIAGENALIYAGMAFAYFQLVNAGIEPGKNIRNADYCANKAFRINNDLAEAHFVMAMINSMSMKPEQAMEHIGRAYAAKPEDPEIMLWLAHAFGLIGRTDHGKAILKKCTKIDPVNPLLNSVIGWNHFYSGSFSQAIEPLTAACKAAPESRMNHFWKALILFYNGMTDESCDYICRNFTEPPADSWSHLSVFLKNVIKGDKEQLRSLLDPDFVKIHQIDPQNSYFLSVFYAHLGKKKKSIEWLENAVQRGFMNYPFIVYHDPFLAEIRNEEKLKKLLKKVKSKWEHYEVYCNATVVEPQY